MAVYNLYVSGILYGKLELASGEPRVRWLDVFAGTLGDWEPITPEISGKYKSFLKMDFLSLAGKWEQYAQALRGKGEFQVSGERYTSEDGVHYLQRDVKFPCNKQVEAGELIAVYCPSREMVTLLVREGCEGRTLLRLWREAWPEEKLFAVSYTGAFDVPMRDGVTLSTDVYLPAGVEGKVPAVLVRTPYGKEEGREVYYRYVQRGYAVVIQDVRGRNKSGGEWVPNYYEVEDGGRHPQLDRRPALVHRQRGHGGRLLPGVRPVGRRGQRQPPISRPSSAWCAPAAPLSTCPGGAGPSTPGCWPGPSPCPKRPSSRSSWSGTTGSRCCASGPCRTSPRKPWATRCPSWRSGSSPGTMTSFGAAPTGRPAGRGHRSQR